MIHVFSPDILILKFMRDGMSFGHAVLFTAYVLGIMLGYHDKFECPLA